MQDAITVKSEATDDGVNLVYAADGLGRRQATATVDGVISMDKQGGLHSLTPLDTLEHGWHVGSI